MESTTYTAFERLSGILDTLRKECPWDREQTLGSLRYLTIEEVHELSEAIVSGNTNDLKKELGDLAMHIMFYCKIAEEQGLFTTADVYNAISDKLIDRHPFIYHKDDSHGESWEQLQEKVTGMDKEWKAESGEWKEDMTEEEFGDYLFALVDWARRHGINADDALCGANYRFRQQYNTPKQ